MNERKVILFISMSLDGFIATRDDDISWLEQAATKIDDFGPLPVTNAGDSYKDVVDSADTYIVGRKTYEVVLNLTGGGFPHAETLACYVITREDRESEKGVQFYNGDLEELINGLKAKEGKNIYCDGGGEVVRLLLEKNLIDEFVVTVIPIILGDGKRLFKGGTPTVNLKPLPPKFHEGGYVELSYQKRSED